MMGKLLEVSRMSAAQLNRTLTRELLDLSSPYLGEYTLVERRGKAMKALECWEEIALRGTQLTMEIQGIVKR